MSVYRRQIPLAIFTIVTLLVVASYYMVYDPLDNLVAGVLKYGITISAFALTLGAINLLKIHMSKIRKKEGQWQFSAWTIACIAVTAGIGILVGPSATSYSWIYANLYVPMGATMYSIVAFYCVSAAYRAFRIKSGESAVLLICAFFMILKNAPIGETIWPGFRVIGAWVNNYPQIIGYRAFWIGVGIGFIAVTVRMMLGKETAFLGDTEEE